MKSSYRAVRLLVIMGVSMFLCCFLPLVVLGLDMRSSMTIAGMVSAGMVLSILPAVVAARRWHIRALSGKKQAAAADDMHAQHTVEIDLPYDAAFDLALAALQSLDRYPATMPWQRATKWSGIFHLRMYHQERATGTLRAGLRLYNGWLPDIADKSRIALTLEKVAAEITRIHIDARNAFPLQVYDTGFNLNFANHLALYLRRESGPESAEMRLSDNLAESDSAPEDSAGTIQHNAGRI